MNLILIAVGVVLLVREYGYWFDWSEFWPVMLILAGLILIFRKTNRPKETDPVQPNVEINRNNRTSSENGGNL